jgi:hypothetical protein
MSEQINEKPKNDKPMPPPPIDPIDPDRVAGALERWEQCPLRDCKRDANLLYADFYLRDMRTNRLMCTACTVRTDAGYMAKEVVRASDDRFYTGNITSDAILFGAMLGGSIVANIIAMFVPFFYFTFIIGSAIGGGLAIQARRMSGKKVTRQSHYFGTGGIILGALITPTLWFFFQTGIFYFSPAMIFNINTLACTAGMIMAAWGVFLRRI